MTFPKLYRAIGLMSGTSLDGVDVAMIESDGRGSVIPLGSGFLPYPDDLRTSIRSCLGKTQPSPQTEATERALTLFHAEAVRDFMNRERLDKTDIDLIGFHGQTIHHDPDRGFTWQLGDGALLAGTLGIDVVNDFRSNDVKNGGQGAPLIPIYHFARARASHVALPAAILNIGGVSNVTWIDGQEENLLAFDCGPGNALIDDLVLKQTGERFDKDGGWARQGQADQDILERWLFHPYFDRRPPKSLDRDAWDVKTISNLPLPIAAATLTAFTVAAIVKASLHFPVAAKSWYVTGGGRLNPAIMTGLETALKVPVRQVDDLGWNGDALEAEGFAYLAVRSVEGLPLSFTGTTGVVSPCTGGTRHRA